MNTKYTPGPWIHDTRGYPHADVRAESGRAIAATWGVNNQPKTQDAYEAQKQVARANARLIAAAPTLLQLVIDVYTDAHSGHELNFLTQQLLEKTLYEIDPELLQEAETLKKANRAEYERIRFMDDEDESE